MARRVKKKVFKFKPFSQKQKQVLTWWTKHSAVKNKDGIIADGAIRSGKTLSMSLSYVMWAMATFSNQSFGMAGKTIGSFRRNVLFWLKLMLTSRGYRWADKRSDNLLEVTKAGVTNYFYIFGGKDESSQDLIQGLTLAGMFFDEVVLMPESFVNQATGRLSVDGSKMWFNCNPEGPLHWFKTKWIDDLKTKNLIYLHFTMEDNLSLTERVKARFKSMYTGLFYQRFILGLWTVSEGVIFDMFDSVKHVFKEVAGLNKDTYISIDYGTQNATVFLLWQKGKDGVWYCLKEYCYSGRENKKQKTDKEFAADLKEFTKGDNVKRVIIDPSAASFIAELKQSGFKVRRANNDVLDGIRYTGTLLNEEAIKFHESCTNLIKEFNAYTWDAKAADKGVDKPVKDHDHSMDALRYFCYTIIRKERKGGFEIWK